MESKTFKEIFNNLLILEGFSKKGSRYYSHVQDLIIVIGLQKSNFANGYYINIGYIVTKLSPDLIYPKCEDGDIRARFSLNANGKNGDFFDLDSFSDEDRHELELHIEQNINQYIMPVVSLEKLKDLLIENPVMLYQAKLNLRRLFGFE